MGTSVKHQQAMNNWGQALSQKIKEKYYQNPKLCKVCKSVIFFEKKFNSHCSMSCASVTRNKGVRRHGNPQQSIDCLICGNKTKPGRRYCSQSCAGKTNVFDVNAWLNGEIDGGNANGCKKPVKNYLLKEANYQCSKCGWNKINSVTNKTPLEINHIDGDSLNNVVSNLEVLCPNCHSLTPNFRALNKNSSRAYRRKPKP
jgi:predicted RNA-binding Zn-ribbon protein involved in translation (DUF1610 family)